MDDWLREGLNDIASKAPGGLEVPTTLKPRARRRMALTVLVSLVMVSFLTVAAVAGVGAIRNAPVPGGSPSPGDSASPSVEPPAPDPNHITVRLTESGCTLESSGEIFDPALLRVQVVNETDDRVFIDIGRLVGDHTVAELVEDVRDRIQPLKQPKFFRRYIYGNSGDGNLITASPSFGDMPAEWQPGPRARGGTYAMVCYLGSWPTGPLVPVGVVGPVEFSPSSSGP